MIILLIGPQGSGKGTEGKLLSEALSLPLIGVGELLRSIPSNHAKYSLVKQQMEKGILVDYETTALVIDERVAKPDCRNGYILDGWLRVLSELPLFDPNPDIVLYFNIPLEESIKRIAGRRVCESTGEILNINTSSPEELAKCKGRLLVRKDDTEETVFKRQAVFDEETLPVIKMYRDKGKLVEIDGLGSVQDVHLRVLKALEISRSKT